MEVKIKDKDNLIDATIEVVDGVMIVSPKEEKWIPKDGDVVYQDGRRKWVFIYMDCLTAEAYHYVSMELPSGNISFKDGEHIGYIDTLRPATEEEKKKLFDRLAEEGLDWDPDKKELVKLKWKPICGQTVFLPDFKRGIFRTLAVVWLGGKSNSMLQKGMVFNTQEECQVFCDKLNQAINQIKP
jgi:hypothetical protein